MVIRECVTVVYSAFFFITVCLWKVAGFGIGLISGSNSIEAPKTTEEVVKEDLPILTNGKQGESTPSTIEHHQHHVEEPSQVRKRNNDTSSTQDEHKSEEITILLDSKQDYALRYQNSEISTLSMEVTTKQEELLQTQVSHSSEHLEEQSTVDETEEIFELVNVHEQTSTPDEPETRDNTEDLKTEEFVRKENTEEHEEGNGTTTRNEEKLEMAAVENQKMEETTDQTMGTAADSHDRIDNAPTSPDNLNEKVPDVEKKSSDMNNNKETSEAIKSFKSGIYASIFFHLPGLELNKNDYLPDGELEELIRKVLATNSELLYTNEQLEKELRDTKIQGHALYRELARVQEEIKKFESETTTM